MPSKSFLMSLTVVITTAVTFAGGAVATLGISAGTAYYTDNTASAGYSIINIDEGLGNEVAIPDGAGGGGFGGGGGGGGGASSYPLVQEHQPIVLSIHT